MTKTSFSAIRESLDKAPNPSAAIVDLTLAQLGGEDLELMELARLAAIPRRLSPEIVGVLRGSEQRTRNEALFERLAQVSFVRERPSGELVYHDSIRELLLENMRSTAELRKTLNDANRRLIHFYRKQYSQASGANIDVQRVASILRRANPNRLASIASKAEQALIPPMLEMLYHATLLGGEQGYEMFVALFDSNESDVRLSACEALLIAIRAFLRELAPETFIDRTQWLRLRDGTIKSERQDWDGAEPIFRSVLSESTDPALRIEALGALGRCLEEQSRLGEAGEAFTEQVRLSQESRVDADAMRVVLVRLGELRYRLGDLQGAAEALSTGVQLESFGTGGWSLGPAVAVLALAEFEQGDRQGALRDFFASFDRIRLDRRYPQLASVVAGLMIEFIRLDHRHLFDALAGEIDGLHFGRADDAYSVEAAAVLVERLTRVGHLERARQELEPALERFGSDSEAIDNTHLLIAAAVLSEAHGSLEEAEGFWSRLIGHPRADDAHREAVALALANRGELRFRLGRLHEAEVDLTTARESWNAIGHKTMPWSIQIVMADMALEAGDPDTTAKLLDEAEQALVGLPRYQGDLLRIRAKLARHCGSHQQAIDLYEAAIDEYVGLGLFERVALVHAEASAVASDFCRWDVAAAHAKRAEAASTELERWARYRPSRNSEAAARLNKHALQLFYGVESTNGDASAEAADLLGRCTDMDSKNFWYRLNLAYVCYAGGSWMAALEHFDSVLLQEPRLKESMVAYRALSCLDLHASNMRADGDAADAISTYEQLEERLRARELYGDAAGIRLKVGDTHVGEGRHEEATGAYEDAWGMAEKAGAHAVQGAAVGRLAVLKAVDGDEDATRTLLSQSLALYRAGESPAPFWQLLADSSVIAGPYLRSGLLDRLVRDLREAPETGVTMNRFKPRLSAEMPPEWVPKESLTLLAPDRSANVIASSEPIAEGLTTQEYADAQGQVLEEEFKGYEQVSLESMTTLGGREGLLRTFAWTPDDGSPVTQMQLYFAKDGNGFTATATTSSESFPRLALQLRQILAGLVLED
jgi:tetratricopeptide (TPR) repeat protein